MIIHHDEAGAIDISAGRQVLLAGYGIRVLPYSILVPQHRQFKASA